MEEKETEVHSKKEKRKKEWGQVKEEKGEKRKRGMKSRGMVERRGEGRNNCRR